ncbi:unnamed protein product [Candida verbasci]|uniref:Thioredoxin domain-containing protein n=1 Tax=Candida verbasci TaxID=1227364 RepID=A0A9W4TY63_9ASCO|nr:unnamed protein product [Candida verbasci]
MSYFYEWRGFKYPAHFIQKIAQERDHIDIYVIDIDELKDTEILQKYKVSNFPSMIYFRGDVFQSFNTNSQNYLTNKELTEDHVRNFVDGIENGEWLTEAIEEDEFQIQMRPGMNKKQGSNDVNDDDLDDILEHIEL